MISTLTLLVIINAVTLHDDINGAAVTSNKDEECLKELLAAHHHNLRISRRIRGRPGHVQPPAPAALLSTHGWIASNMTSYPATWSFCNVDIVYFLDPTKGSECECRFLVDTIDTIHMLTWCR